MSAATKERPSLFHFLLIFSSFLFITLACQSEASAARHQDAFEPIKEKLARDGFPPDEVALIEKSNPSVLLKTVSRTMRIREGRLNYAQFLDSRSMSKARQFHRMHGPLLLEAETGYGVDHCVIVAILLVETRFGSYTGKTPTVDILATFALMDHKQYRDKVWRLLRHKDRKRWGRNGFDRKLMDRSRWAYDELRALLQLAKARTVRIASCRGSVMGAIGWPQFLPSSLVRYGVDGDKDGSIDLFEPADAVFSIANYLKGYGWKQDISQAEKEEVIYGYNHSRPYVDTILGIAAKLRAGG